MTSDVKLLPLPKNITEALSELGPNDQARVERWIEQHARACVEADRKSMTGRAIGTVVELDGRHSFIPIDHAFITPVGAKQTLVYTHPAPDDVARLVAAARSIRLGFEGDLPVIRGSAKLHPALEPFTATQQEAELKEASET